MIEMAIEGTIRGLGNSAFIYVWVQVIRAVGAYRAGRWQDSEQWLHEMAWFVVGLGAIFVVLIDAVLKNNPFDFAFPPLIVVAYGLGVMLRIRYAPQPVESPAST
jgi:hypothetical protein